MKGNNDHAFSYECRKVEETAGRTATRGALDALRSRLPPDAVALAVAEWPGMVICHKGRAFGLHLKQPGVPLTLAQTNAVIAMRDAGMRVEIATGPDQAIARVHEMGVALKEDERRGLRDLFRKETRR